MSISKHSYVGRSGTRLHAPPGFYFSIIPDGGGFKVNLYRRGRRTDRVVGHINLHLEEVFANGKRKILETHSWLEARYRNCGYGALMYARAIQYALDNGHRVQSSGMSSDFAVRVWEGKYLRKHFKIREEVSPWSGSLWKAYAKPRISKTNKRYSKTTKRQTSKRVVQR